MPVRLNHAFAPICYQLMDAFLNKGAPSTPRMGVRYCYMADDGEVHPARVRAIKVEIMLSVPLE